MQQLPERPAGQGEAASGHIQVSISEKALRYLRSLAYAEIGVADAAVLDAKVPQIAAEILTDRVRLLEMLVPMAEFFGEQDPLVHHVVVPLAAEAVAAYERATDNRPGGADAAAQLLLNQLPYTQKAT